MLEHKTEGCVKAKLSVCSPNTRKQQLGKKQAVTCSSALHLPSVNYEEMWNDCNEYLTGNKNIKLSHAESRQCEESSISMQSRIIKIEAN